MSLPWDYWINQPIYLDDGVYNILKRKEAIHIFCYEGLFPLIYKAGYSFRHDDKIIFHLLLTALYDIYLQNPLRIRCQRSDYLEEQYTEFEDILDTQVWMNFWKKWGRLEDFQEYRYGRKFFYTLPTLVWSWIDIDMSPRARRLQEDIEIMEAHEEATKGKDDPYLAETAKHDYQDRHWH